MIHRTHVDLFSGLGGFARAARANGIETVQFCEIEERCRGFLGKAWPGVAIHDDIRTFRWGVADAARRGLGTDGSAPRSGRHPDKCGEVDTGANTDEDPARVYLLTAGVPCQPASRAGKQGGASDDRWLWPEALRVVAEVRPIWALLENPPGIADLFEYGVQLDVETETVSAFTDGVLGDHRVSRAVGKRGTTLRRTGAGVAHDLLEEIKALGYDVQPVGIPACAVNAPHRRMRYWIVCRRKDPMADAGCLGSGEDQPGRGAEGRAVDRRAGAGNLGDPDEERSEERERDGAESRCGDKGRDGQDHADALAYPTGNLADSEHNGSGAGRGVEPAKFREYSEGEELQGSLGHTEGGRGGAGPGEGDTEQDGHGIAGTGPWDRYVWLPCADGKLRRAPDVAELLVDGRTVGITEILAEEGWPHRSVLAALGNGIVWQVAAEIIAAMVAADQVPQ